MDRKDVARQIVDLINSKPRSPTVDEIEAVLEVETGIDIDIKSSLHAMMQRWAARNIVVGSECPRSP